LPFTYLRTIRFQDTDAAGVVYFANVLAMCHEAYEESLAASGIHLPSFFSGSPVGFPIVHASVDFFRPMFCGDRQVISLTPEQLDPYTFAIVYEIFSAEASDRLVATADTRHVCLDSTSRTRKEIPPPMIQWLHQWQA